MMTTLDLVQRHEGFKPQVYCDRCGSGLLKTRVGWQCKCLSQGQEAGNLTVGIGTRVDGPGITKAEARQVAAIRLQEIAGELDDHPGFDLLDEVRKSAILDMAYNMGVLGVSHFVEMWACLEKGDYDGAADAVLRSIWARQVPTRAADIANLLRTGAWEVENG